MGELRGLAQAHCRGRRHSTVPSRKGGGRPELKPGSPGLTLPLLSQELEHLCPVPRAPGQANHGSLESPGVVPA